jgi:hypothetical protein
LEIEVDKSGRRPRVTYSRADQKGLEVETSQSKLKAIFPEGPAIIFRTQMNPTDFELSQRLFHVTSSWLGNQHGRSWNARLTSRPWRIEEGGEIYAQVLLNGETTWDSPHRSPNNPVCALPVTNTVEAPTDKEANTRITAAIRAPNAEVLGHPGRIPVGFVIVIGRNRFRNYPFTLQRDFAGRSKGAVRETHCEFPGTGGATDAPQTVPTSIGGYNTWPAKVVVSLSVTFFTTNSILARTDLTFGGIVQSEMKSICLNYPFLARRRKSVQLSPVGKPILTATFTR